jgi:hypothetical protein
VGTWVNLNMYMHITEMETRWPISFKNPEPQVIIRVMCEDLKIHRSSKGLYIEEEATLSYSINK